MKLTKSLKITFLAILAVVVSILGVMMMESRYVSATVDTFQMVSGAEARIVGSNTEDYGIRFKANIHKDDEDLKETDRFFVMIIPSGWIDTYGLTNGCDYYKILVEDNGKVAEGENRTVNIMESLPELVGDYYEIKGSITNVKYANSFRDFFGIVYKTDADGVSNRKYAKFVDGENERNISQVVSAELNVGGHLKEQTDYMLDMVKNAYNAQKGNATATEDLPAISAESVALAIEKDKTYQLTAPVGIPENIDIEVKWTTSNENSATVENGLVTVKSDNANADIKVKVLGTEYQMASVSKADFVLNDFSKEDSYKDLRTKSSGVYDGEWKEEVTLGGETRNGVVKIANDTANRHFYVTFDDSYDVLKKISDNFDYITVSLYYETAETVSIQNTSWSMKGEVFSSNTWVDVKITKEFISAEGSVSFWSYYMPATGYETVSDYFWYCHARGGAGIYVGRPLLRPDYAGEGYLYVDSITLHSNAEVEDYVVPNAGETFKIPTATFKDSAGAIVSTETNATVTHNGSTVEVVDGKFTAESGIYNINYATTYNGEEITKTISFDVARAPMAANMLEDFNDISSLENVANANDSSSAREEWLPTYDGATGVVRVNLYMSDVNGKFNRTLDELKEMTINSITVKLWIDAPWTPSVTIFGVSKTTKQKEWVEITLTKEEIIAANTSWDNFLSIYSSEGTGRKLFYFSSGASYNVYFDSITFA
ncbi:MAG: Ig-like domain-containing protein [Clostridia bacterium]|nr:Ig-like domain-containing protein [Clostridia bacterium]